MSADRRSDVDLLDAARSGDEGALAVLVERHREMPWRAVLCARRSDYTDARWEARRCFVRSDRSTLLLPHSL
jgi:hypothetical protein